MLDAQITITGETHTARGIMRGDSVHCVPSFSFPASLYSYPPARMHGDYMFEFTVPLCHNAILCARLALLLYVATIRSESRLPTESRPTTKPNFSPSLTFIFFYFDFLSFFVNFSFKAWCWNCLCHIGLEGSTPRAQNRCRKIGWLKLFFLSSF